MAATCWHRVRCTPTTTRARSSRRSCGTSSAPVPGERLLRGRLERPILITQGARRAVCACDGRENGRSTMQIARFIARLTIGGLFIGHGTQKLMGWFGGPGLEGTDQMMQALELHPPRSNALAAGITETAGGALVAAGLCTPLGASGLIGVMTTAIRKVHWSKGVWN